MTKCRGEADVDRLHSSMHRTHCVSASGNLIHSTLYFRAMPVPSYNVECIHRSFVAKDVYELRFRKPESFTFKPGQFVLFEVPLIENPGDVQTRALSLGSTPDEPELVFIAKLKEGGRVSRWIAEKLTEGSTMTMKGPFGFFLLDQKTDKDPLFIATSAGVAPFRSMILDVLQGTGGRRLEPRRRMDLIFGVRSEEDLFWTEELTELTKRYDNVFLHIALSAPSDTWTGHRGRVQTLAPLIVKDFVRRTVYVCGNPDMTNELKKLCLEQWNVPKQDLHVEGYI